MTQTRTSNTSADFSDQIQIIQKYQSLLIDGNFDSAVTLFHENEVIRQSLICSQDCVVFANFKNFLDYFELVFHAHKAEMSEFIWDNNAIFKACFREDYVNFGDLQNPCYYMPTDNQTLNLIKDVLLTAHPGLINKILGGNNRVFNCFANMPYGELVSLLTIAINALNDETQNTIIDLIHSVTNEYALRSILSKYLSYTSHKNVCEIIQNHLNTLANQRLVINPENGNHQKQLKRQLDDGEVNIPPSKKRIIDKQPNVSANPLALYTRMPVLVPMFSSLSDLPFDLAEKIRNFPTREELTETYQGRGKDRKNQTYTKTQFTVELEVGELLQKYSASLSCIGITQFLRRNSSMVQVNIIDWEKYEAALQMCKPNMNNTAPVAQYS